MTALIKFASQPDGTHCLVLGEHWHVTFPPLHDGHLQPLPQDTMTVLTHGFAPVTPELAFRGMGPLYLRQEQSFQP